MDNLNNLLKLLELRHFLSQEPLFPAGIWCRVLDNNEIELNEDGSLFLVKLMNAFADIHNKTGRFSRPLNLPITYRYTRVSSNISLVMRYTGALCLFTRLYAFLRIFIYKFICYIRSWLPFWFNVLRSFIWILKETYFNWSFSLIQLGISLIWILLFFFILIFIPYNTIISFSLVIIRILSMLFNIFLNSRFQEPK